MNELHTIAPAISSAIQKLVCAASENYGKDCFIHAMLAQKAIKEFAGLDTTLVVGFAAWRVGEGDGDIILHAPTPDMVYQENALPYHAWLATDDYLIDFSTYQLRGKAEQLDALDGGSTQVDWCPDYLIIEHSEIAAINDVIQKNAGLFFYAHNERLENKVKSLPHAIDEGDWYTFLTIYNNPNVVVFGPNNGM